MIIAMIGRYEVRGIYEEDFFGKLKVEGHSGVSIRVCHRTDDDTKHASIIPKK